MLTRYLLVMLGAALGGVARYAAGTLILQRFNARFPESIFPVGTLIVNVTGCFLIGVLMSLFVERGDPSPQWRLFLVTGILGGYTTFSSFAWESFEAIEKAQVWIGLANITLSVVLGYLAVWCGSLAARVLR
jgi:fluoride exporter